VTAATPPYDQAAEEALLGACLGSTAVTDEVDLRVGDFYVVRHQVIWGAMLRMRARGEPIDLTLVAAECGRDEHGQEPVTVIELRALYLQAGIHHESYARAIRNASYCRRAIALSDDLHAAGYTGDIDAVGDVVADLDSRLAAPLETVVAEELTDLLSDESAAAEKPWVIPGCLRRLERYILTGAEGGGKSSWLRQVAMCVAAGIHPFTGLQVGYDGAPIEPTPTLVVDLQEDRLDLRDAFRVLHRRAPSYEAGNLHAVSRSQGMNLLEPEHRRWLEALVAHHRPGLVVMGPVRKLYRQTGRYSKSSEEAVDELTRILDDLRRAYGFALILEAHSGHDRDDWRVRGSSVWFDWPEFGHGLALTSFDPREAEVRHWRADRHVGRLWPARLRGGTRWPWEPSAKCYDRIMYGLGLGELIAPPESLAI
jgi:replicative DNA helicase